jgi:hypothetical protein
LAGSGVGCPLLSPYTVCNRALCTQSCAEVLCQQSHIRVAKDEIHFNSVACLNAARSKAWFCGCLLAGIGGSNLAWGVDFCCDCAVLSGRGLCDGLITRPEESYRLWCVVVCDLET